MSGVAVAAPRTITLKVQDAPLYDVSRKLAEQSGCRIMGFTHTAKVTLDVTNATLWDVLAKLEIDFGIQTQFRGSQIVLEQGAGQSRSYWGIDPQPTWSRHWKGGAGGWATAVVGDTVDTRAKLAILGLDAGTVEKITFDKAVSGGKNLKVSPGVPIQINPCEPAVVILDFDSAPKKLTLRGHALVRIPKQIEKRVAVPLDNSIVDIAEGRLRLHIGSKVDPNYRKIHVGWDGMGEQVKVSVALVDDQNKPVSTSGRGTSSSMAMGSEDFTVDASLTKLFVVLKIPGTATTDEKVLFRFDNETLDKPQAPQP